MGRSARGNVDPEKRSHLVVLFKLHRATIGNVAIPSHAEPQRRALKHATESKVVRGKPFNVKDGGIRFLQRSVAFPTGAAAASPGND